MPRKAALVIQPVGALVEQLAGDPYDRAIAELMGESQPQTLVQDIVDALEAARDDDRIGAVHIELSALTSAGIDKLERVSQAIADFQTSGKPVIASADFYTQQGYFIAAHADEVYLNPEGIVFLQGYGSYRTFYKDAIDLLRIDLKRVNPGNSPSMVPTPIWRTHPGALRWRQAAIWRLPHATADSWTSCCRGRKCAK